MRWHGGSGIIARETALVLMIVFIVLSFFICADKKDFWWQLSLTIAGMAASIWITLVVIERAIKRDREHQWEKVKSLTYMNILNGIIYIALGIAEEVAGSIIDTDYKLYDCTYMLSSGVNSPGEYISVYISDILETTKDGCNKCKYRGSLCVDFDNLDEPGYIDEFDDTDELDYLGQLNNMNKSYFIEEFNDTEELGDNEAEESPQCPWKRLPLCIKNIDKLIDDIITTLIPRVLIFNDDPEVNLALTRFETVVREFRQGRGLLEFKEYIIKLLQESIELYEILQRKLPEQRGDPVYIFKEETAFLMVFV